MELKLAPSPNVIDPVCGMEVDPATSKGSHVHDGQTYHFCSVSCLNKFRAEPPKYLGGRRDSMETASHAPAGARRYVCPMDPDVVSDRPGACPKCGMALEPETPVLDEPPDPEFIDMSRRLWFGLILGIPLFVLVMLDMLPAKPVTGLLGSSKAMILQWVLCTPIVFGCGWPFFVRAWVSRLARSANMFTLIALGVSAAYVYSVVIVFDQFGWTHLIPHGLGMIDPYFESAAAIVVLVLVGQVLELRARHRTGNAIRALLHLTPKTGRLVLPDGKEEDVPVELLQAGDRVRIRPGEKVPIDGVVREGTTFVDESMLTGEPNPVSKEAGTTVSAGTLNGNGTILVETQRTGGGTLLAQIAHLVGQAQRSRIPMQALVDRVAAWFVPAVLLASIVTFLLWAFFGTLESRWTFGVINGVAVLIIACPCALGLAAPMAVIVGMGRGAAAGALFRNAETLERLSQVDTLVFDKTGTLTAGRPEVTVVEPAQGTSTNELLKVAASLELGSEHPLAGALIRRARQLNIELAAANETQSHSGRGIQGRIDGRTVLIGTNAFLAENGIADEVSRRRLEDLRQDAQTVLLVAVDGRFTGLIAVSDPIRPSTRPAIESLRLEGIRLVMLTGDSRTTADAVARKVGLAEVLAEVLPADKHSAIRKLQAEGHVVAMAGDGINDSPALAQADVGIAMGGGADVAIESAGVTLIRPDLGALVFARHLSKATMRTIRQNLVLAFIYNVVAIPIAAGILVPFGGGLIGPIWAAAAMSLSSLSVVGNSLRLRRLR